MALSQSEQLCNFKFYMDSRDDQLLEVAGAKATSNIAGLLCMQDQIELAAEYCETSIHLSLHNCKSGTRPQEKRHCVILPSHLKNILQLEDTVKREITGKTASIASGLTYIDHPSQFNEAVHDTVVIGMHFFDKPLLFGSSQKFEIAQSLLMNHEDFRPTSMLFNMALIHHRANKLDTATKLFKMSKLSACPSNHEIFDPSCSCMLMEVMADNNIGHIYYREGRYQEAAKHFTAALGNLHSISESFCDFSQNTHFYDCLTWTLLNLTRIAIFAEDYDKAMSLSQKALSSQRKSPSKNDLDVSFAHYNIGRIHHERGDLKEAIKFYTACFQQVKAQLGSYHPLVATILYSIGQVYFDQCKYQTASQNFLQSLHIREAIFGRVHKDVANTYYSIGRTLHDREQHGDAIRAYQKALSIQTSLVGTFDKEVVKIMCNIGRLHHKMGNLEQSLAMNQSMMQTAETLLGYDHPFIATTLKTIGFILIELGRVEEAMEVLTRGARINDGYEFTSSYMGLVGRECSAASAA